MFTSPAARLVLSLGALSATVLVGAAFVDIGDPVAAARARIDQSVEAQEELVRLAWDRVLRNERLPAPALGIDVVLAPDLVPFPEAAEVPDEATTDLLFDVLLDAAIAAGLAGEFGAALSGVEDALDTNPTAQRANEAHLHAARWWSALGATVEVERHRRALLELQPGQLIEGTSANLLALLVVPVDAAAAWTLLAEQRATLPTPNDTVRVVDTALVFDADPWWATLRESLEGAAPELDWRTAFLRERREALAVQRFAAGSPPTTDERWSLRSVDGAVVAQRRGADGLRVTAIDATGLSGSLREAAGSGAPSVFETAFGADRLDEREARTLAPSGPEGFSLSYSVLRPTPLTEARGEIRRLRLVRGALVGLAVLMLLGAIVSARAMDRARRLAELRGTFVASVSHDLRTPTQAILLLAETLEQDRIATPESRAKYHASIRREAQRLRRLVEDLLDGARVDRGEVARIDRREVSTAEFIDDLEAAMRERAERSGATLRVVRGRLPERLEVDPDGVHRAIWNLFENALVHGGRGEDPASVVVEITQAGGVLEVTVADDGAGIPARLRETVFEPFERIADRRERTGMQNDTGTGLGLSIVRALSRAHGGDARVAPSERGARFVATFRLGDKDEEGAA